MSPNQPGFVHAIGDEVVLADNNTSGIVEALFCDEGGEQYRVRYVDRNGLICDRYVRAGQILDDHKPLSAVG